MTEQDASDPEQAHEDAAGDGSVPEESVGSDEGAAGADDAPPGAADATVDAEAPSDGETPFDGEVDDELVDRVAESDPESVARELAALRARTGDLEARLAEREAELDEVTDKLKRKQADFQNYKKRTEKRREREKRRATEDLVERLFDVRDNLVRATEQDEADAADILDGVESTLSQFDRVLEDENVDVVEPEPGDEVDPHTHEVLMRVDSDQPADTIADVHRPGYVMADKVLQTAQVTVSDGSADGDDSEADESAA